MYPSVPSGKTGSQPSLPPRGPWAGVTDVEIGTAEYLDWFNHRRLHGEIGHIPPAEYETNHYAANPASSTELATTGSLH